MLINSNNITSTWTLSVWVLTTSQTTTFPWSESVSGCTRGFFRRPTLLQQIVAFSMKIQLTADPLIALANKWERPTLVHAFCWEQVRRCDVINLEPQIIAQLQPINYWVVDSAIGIRLICNKWAINVSKNAISLSLKTTWTKWWHAPFSIGNCRHHLRTEKPDRSLNIWPLILRALQCTGRGQRAKYR